MLVTLRLGVPTTLVPQVRELLEADPHVSALSIVPGASVRPSGDLVIADLPREAASEVLGVLERTGLAEHGTIVVTDVAAAPSRRAREADRLAPGAADDGVIWGIVEEQGWDAAAPSFSFFAFLALAVLLAGVAVLTDSPVLVVGAMVVGPEFAAVAAICTGLTLRRPRMVLGALRLLVTGFVLAVSVTLVAALVGRALGWVTPEMVTASRPLTGFIWRPDHWSVVVALLAGTAGVLSLTGSKSNALVGVFISVTTVPAAGNLALALAVWDLGELRGSLLQLGVNLAGMVLAGVLTLLGQRWLWSRVSARGLRALPRGRL